MKRRRQVLTAGAIALVMSAGPGKAQEFINVLTGGTSGVYYPLGVALSEIYAEGIEGARTQVQATKASVENLNLLQEGRGEIAFSLGDSVQLAVEGNAEAGFPAPLDKLRGIAAIYPNYIQIVASAESGIETLADLKGKSLSVGAPASGTELNARAIFAAAGLTYEDLGPGRIPALRGIGRADQEPPARRHAAVGRSRRRFDPRSRDLGPTSTSSRCRRRWWRRSVPRMRRPSFRPGPMTGRRPTCRQPPSAIS